MRYVRTVICHLLLLTFFYCLSMFGSGLRGQIGGLSTYDFLNLSPSARMTAMGGRNVSLRDKDASMIFSNPALLNDSMHTSLNVNYVNFFKDVAYGSAVYSHSFDSVGRFAVGFQNFTYGAFDERNDLGQKIGEYTVGANALTMSYGRSFGAFSGGVNVRILQSTFYQTSTWGFATDFGGAYYSAKKRIGLGIVLRNVGAQFNAPFPDGSTGNLPLDLNIGFTKKLAKAPFRFSLTGINLLRPTVAYEDPNAPTQFDLAGNEIPKPNRTFDNIFSHIIFGLEVLISENFHLRAGYNHQRRNEMQIERTDFNLNGFSFGLGFRVYRFHLDYGYARFHMVGGIHQFGVHVYLNKWKKKNAAPPTAEPQTQPLEPAPPAPPSGN